MLRRLVHNKYQDLNGMFVEMCKAEKGDGHEYKLEFTVILADMEAARRPFDSNSAPLFVVDGPEKSHDYVHAWTTLRPLGYISREDRLKVLLGQEVEVNGWKISILH